MAGHQSRIPAGACFRPASSRLLDQVREVMRHYHYSLASERTYVQWIVKYVRFHGTRHPRELGKRHIEAFLTHLAVAKNCAASTQKQAFNALVFLYRHVLLTGFPEDIKATRVSKAVRVPVVLTTQETAALLDRISPRFALMAQLMYGGGLRLMECLRLRVQDIDFGNGFLVIRQGKGGKDRTTLLPEALIIPLQAQLNKAQAVYEQDKREGLANVWLPDALARKLPQAGAAWNWQWVFPAKTLSADPRSGEIRRHHVHESAEVAGACQCENHGNLYTRFAG